MHIIRRVFAVLVFVAWFVSIAAYIGHMESQIVAQKQRLYSDFLRFGH
jgi:hypothetical protein